MKMGDLLELVNECDKMVPPAEASDEMAKLERARDKAKELYGLGLVKVAQEIADKVDLKYRMARVRDGRYIVIRDENIKKFLEKKAKEYNEQRVQEIDQEVRHRVTFVPDNYHVANVTSQARMFNGSLGAAGVLGDREVMEQKVLQVATLDRNSATPGTIGMFRWKEVPLSQYAGVPPAHVLTKLAEEKTKGIFNEYRVASVEGIHDPLLLGVVKGCEDRWFLSQWADDVCLDDVI